jgi:hypothetical protein
MTIITWQEKVLHLQPIRGNNHCYIISFFVAVGFCHNGNSPIGKWCYHNGDIIVALTLVATTILPWE